MTIVMVSNYFNHHQKPFADAMAVCDGIDYKFICTDVMSESRKKLGYGDNDVPEYVIDRPTSRKSYKEIIKTINSADVVIWGAASRKFLKERLAMGKLTFRCTERLFKKGFSVKEFLPRAVKHVIINRKCKNQYLLCASAYAASDYAKIGLYRNRAYKWGYFTEAKLYDEEKLLAMKKANPCPLILWAGRLIDWKHPEYAVLTAERLKHEDYKFDMQIIGNGVLEDKLAGMIDEKNLHDCVNMLGAMPPDKVRDYMERANIYLFTSDQNEGWGAVLNEAMNSGCAVVADKAIGSAPYLIADGENGLVYENYEQMYSNIKKLLDSPGLQRKLGINAYNTIIHEWNPKNAARKFMELLSDIVRKEAIKIKNGVCSPAS